jgi:lysyl-tRNA synthetase class 1
LDKDADAQLIYIGDTIDPLRKVYPFLDESYKEHVGKPLSEIPCPCGSHISYSEHFLTPFLEAAQTLGIKANVKLSHEMYAQGLYAEASKRILDNKDRIKEILQSVSKRDLPDDWFPYNPKCSECERLTTAKVTGYEYPFVSYSCSCGTCEPFGKDHAAAGGSYDTAKMIAKEIFDQDAPHPVVYEWIQLKGKGAMSSSTGVVVSAAKMLKMTPPEVFRFFVLRNNPNKHLDFDPGLGILNLVDEFDTTEKNYFGEGSSEKSERIEKIEGDLGRTYELSQPFSMPTKPPFQIPYRHLVSVVQIKDDFESILDILKRTELFNALEEWDVSHLKQRIECVKFWLDSFAPDRVKFAIAKETPKMELVPEHKEYLSQLSLKLSEEEWTPDGIHNAIYELAQAHNLKSKAAFQLVYRAILDEKFGPRLGYFLSTLDKDFVVNRIGEVTK